MLEVELAMETAPLLPTSHRADRPRVLALSSIPAVVLLVVLYVCAPDMERRPRAASSALAREQRSSSSSDDASESVLALLNATGTDSVVCHVPHALCDVSTCVLSDDKATASCGCMSSDDEATLALGWASAVLAQDAHYLKALRKYANRTHVAEDDSALCEAIGNGEVWPHARAVSLWSVGSLIDDGVDTIDCEARRGDAGLYGANCMGAPCFANEYKGTPASTWDLTCVCPVHEYGATLADIKLSRPRSTLCGLASSSSGCAVVVPGWHEYGEAELDALIAELGQYTDASSVDSATCANNCTYCADSR